MRINRAFWELPDGWRQYTDKQWSQWHHARAKALGCEYDEELADDHVAFFRCLKHIDGEWAGKSFEPMPWQEHQIIRPLFGYLKADGYRRFERVFVAIPKKNGKSELAAGMALDLTLFDGEPGAQVYGAAHDFEQAGLVYRVAAGMVEQDDDLGKYLKPIGSTRRIVYHAGNSFYRVLSSDKKGSGKHGANRHGLIIDEEHTISDAEFIRTLRFGSGDARRQPVELDITTAGFDRNSFCFQDWSHARDVRDGKVAEPTLLPVIYELDENEDWEDEANWLKVNPSLGVTIDIEKVRTAYRVAKQLPAEENSFRRLRLNQWTSQETRWLPMARWDACGPLDDRGHTLSLPELGRIRQETLAKLAGHVCYGGLDLSNRLDLTTFQLVFPEQDGHVANLGWFFLPKENLANRSERDRALYEEWARYGFIELTEGTRTDYAVVRQRINELRDRFKFRFRDIGYDDWNAGKIEDELASDGFNMMPIKQSLSGMNSPTKTLLELVVGGQFDHSGNPVMRWMADNLQVKQDHNERVQPVKAQDRGRIDGIVGAIMAIDVMTRHEDDPGPSVYESRGIESISL